MEGHGRFLAWSGRRVWLLRERGALVATADQLEQLIDSMEPARKPQCEVCGCKSHSSTEKHSCIKRICTYTQATCVSPMHVNTSVYACIHYTL